MYGFVRVSYICTRLTSSIVDSGRAFCHCIMWHYVIGVLVRSFSGMYFPSFEINTETYEEKNWKKIQDLAPEIGNQSFGHWKYSNHPNWWCTCFFSIHYLMSIDFMMYVYVSFFVHCLSLYLLTFLSGTYLFSIKFIVSRKLIAGELTVFSSSFKILRQSISK